MDKPLRPDKRKAPAKPPAPFARRLIIMAKLPVMGRVKTRLARQAGTVAATCFYRQTARALIGRLGGDPRWQTIIAVDPDNAANSTAWPPQVSRTGQGRGGLGERMQRLLEAPPPGPVVIIGTDIPGLSRNHVAKAFKLLAASDCVLGPAEDGGYWLVGLRRSPRVVRPFSGVRWSSPHALADTRANLAGRRVELADQLADVDSGEDLARFRAIAGRRILPRP